MAFAKCMTGIWIFLLPATSHSSTVFTGSSEHKIIDVPLTPTQSITIPALVHESRIPSDFSGTTAITDEEKADLTIFRESISKPSQPNRPPSTVPTNSPNIVPSISDTTTVTQTYSSKLQSRLYPAILLSLAMTTRGEIGFLISAVGQSSGLLVPENVYLIVQWGIVLCTLGGPIGVGLVVRKIRRGKSGLLGSWGQVEDISVPL